MYSHKNNEEPKYYEKLLAKILLAFIIPVTGQIPKLSLESKFDIQNSKLNLLQYLVKNTIEQWTKLENITNWQKMCHDT